MKKIILFGIFLILLPIVMVLTIVSSVFIMGDVSTTTIDSGNTTNIGLSPEVLSYKPLVEKYCKIENIPDQVNLILAIMMQESGGRVPDVMQSSESLGLPVNTLYNQRKVSHKE